MNLRGGGDNGELRQEIALTDSRSEKEKGRNK